MTMMDELGLCFSTAPVTTDSVRKGFLRMALAGVIVVGLVACGSSADDSGSSDDHLESAPGVEAAPHAPAVGSPERTAFMDGVRKVFDERIRSTAAAEGRKDVEFAVYQGADAFCVGSRNGVTWGFVAATAQDPSTHAPFDFSHAPPDIQASVKDEQGHPNPRRAAREGLPRARRRDGHLDEAGCEPQLHRDVPLRRPSDRQLR
jgi:hypothetical protein